MFIALLQVFVIGLSIGLSGPCLFYCLPIILTFISGTQKGYKKSLVDIIIFFSGRLFAYTLLGCLAGISGLFVRRFLNSSITGLFNPLAGLISIGLGVFIFFNEKAGEKECKRKFNGIGASGGLFLFGFIIGVSPCAPLVALLFEIALISKNALQGALYGLFFGLGTFVSGVIVTMGIAGLAAWVPEKLLKSAGSRLALRIVCSSALILFGVWFILWQRK